MKKEQLDVRAGDEFYVSVSSNYDWEKDFGRNLSSALLFGTMPDGSPIPESSQEAKEWAERMINITKAYEKLSEEEKIIYHNQKIKIETI